MVSTIAQTTPSSLSSKAEAATWARKVLDDLNSVILDVETTGLGKYPDTGIVQLSLINMKGQCLLSVLLNPEIPIPLEASNIHGISNRDVSECPKFSDIAPALSILLKDKNVIAYNVKFDITLLVSTYKGLGLPVPYFKEECCMEEYAKYAGEWNHKHGNYKFKKLPSLAYGKAHDSLCDCLSTLELIKIMAGGPSINTEEEFKLDF